MWTGAATGQEREMGTTLKFQISLKCVAAPSGAALHVLHTWELDVTVLFS